MNPYNADFGKSSQMLPNAWNLVNIMVSKSSTLNALQGHSYHQDSQIP